MVVGNSTTGARSVTLLIILRSCFVMSPPLLRLPSNSMIAAQAIGVSSFVEDVVRRATHITPLVPMSSTSWVAAFFKSGWSRWNGWGRGQSSRKGLYAEFMRTWRDGQKGVFVIVSEGYML